jgi:hypothetical protein
MVFLQKGQRGSIDIVFISYSFINSVLKIKNCQRVNLQLL